MRQITLYNAYTGISPLEKGALVHFLCQHAGGATTKSVEEAMDYALKRKPSFGGFIIAIREQMKIIAAIVVNRTGMDGFSPKNICVYVAIDKSHSQLEELLQQLLQKAIHHANGDLAMHVEPDHPALHLYQRMGFRAQYLELRLD